MLGGQGLERVAIRHPRQRAVMAARAVLAVERFPIRRLSSGQKRDGEKAQQQRQDA